MTEPDYSAGSPGGAQPEEFWAGPKFKSVRRAFRIIDIISRRGEELTAKELAGEIGTNLSSCYYLLNLLSDEGYIEKLPRGGYRIGPIIPTLNDCARSDFDSKTAPVIAELARKTQRHAYSAVLSDGEVTVTRVETPRRPPPVGVVEGFHGGSHALALGKVLLAAMGSEYVESYVDNYGLEAFTPRTIVAPALLHAHLNKVRMVGVATDFEEFASNLCCVAAPVESGNGTVQGAIGISTTPRRIRDEGQDLVEMVTRAAEEASALLGK